MLLLYAKFLSIIFTQKSLMTTLRQNIQITFYYLQLRHLNFVFCSQFKEKNSTMDNDLDSKFYCYLLLLLLES